ncbi:MAG: O-antigen ligase family protein [Rhodospirillaceae bacterium]|nr:O-antigen ligase family protein [Rhodospirillaceae bacterium]MBL6932862.1 O-antigen ligase family protein [Rhodospirillales bacterium]
MNQKENWCEQVVEKSLMGICLLAGILGVVASKAMTVLVALSGLVCFISFLINRKQHPKFVSVFIVTLSLLFVWAGISSIWALNGSGALQLCFRLTFLCLAGFVLLHASTTASSVTQVKSQKALLIGFGLSVLALIIGYTYAQETGDSLWGGYYFDPLTTLNNGAVIVALLLWPVTLMIWHNDKPTTAVLLLLAVSSGLMFLSSGASLLAICVGGLVYVSLMFFGRPAALVIAFATVGFIFIAPVISEKITNSETIMEIVENSPSSVKHRLIMWDFVSQKIDETPYWGFGMDSSRRLPQEEFRLASNMEIMPLHPHNAALQIRLELGLPGIVLAAALVLSLFWTVLKEAGNRQQMAVRISILCSYLSVGVVSYGVWQSWWIATAWALAAIVQIVLPSDQSRIP